MYVCVRMCQCACMYVPACMCVCVYVCMAVRLVRLLEWVGRLHVHRGSGYGGGKRARCTCLVQALTFGVRVCTYVCLCMCVYVCVYGCEVSADVRVDGVVGVCALWRRCLQGWVSVWVRPARVRVWSELST